jgi:serine/threonine-protein kinase
LAEIEARLSRAIGPIARRLVADAARQYGSASQIRQALAAHIEDPREREAFLKTNPSGTVIQAAAAVSASAPVAFDAAMLERMTQALAPHLGPIAKVLVAKAARNARSAEELQNALAAEIPAAERERFLAAVRRRG